MTDDRYGSDVLAGFRKQRGPAPIPTLAIEKGLVLEETGTGFVGAIVSYANGLIELEGRKGEVRTFSVQAGFMVDGATVRLVKPTPGAAPVLRSASGSVAVTDHTARVALPSRIFVEGRHDAELVEKVWGEAPLFIRPYLAKLSRSELFVVMTGGMAGIAGTVLVLMLLAGRREASPGLAVTLATGTASGLISGLASLGGMVLSLFWLAGPSHNAGVRGSSVAFFVPASVLSGALMAFAGIFTPEVLRLPKLLVHMAAKAERLLSFGLLRSVADYADETAMRAAAQEARQFGFDGASCIHPAIVPILNAAFAPTQADIAWARRVVAASEEAAGRDVIEHVLLHEEADAGALERGGDIGAVEVEDVAGHRQLVARGPRGQGGDGALRRHAKRGLDQLLGL